MSQSDTSGEMLLKLTIVDGHPATAFESKVHPVTARDLGVLYGAMLNALNRAVKAQIQAYADLDRAPDCLRFAEGYTDGATTAPLAEETTVMTRERA